MKKLLAIAVPILAVLLYGSLLRIPEGSVGVAQKESGVEALGPGIHWRRPFSAPPTLYRLDLPSAGEEIQVAFSEGSRFSLAFDLSGKLDPSRIAAFHKEAARIGADSILKAAGARGLAEAASLKVPADLTSDSLENDAARRAGMLLAALGVGEVTLKLRPLGAAQLLDLAQALAPARLAGRLKEPISGILASGSAGWEAHTAMGLVLESEKDVHGAEKEYLDALTMNPAAIPPMAQLVAIYSAVGEFAKLDRLLEAGIETSPSSLQHFGWLAMSQLRQNRPKDAEATLRHAIELEPGSPTLLNNLAGVLVKQGRLDEAIETLRNALQAKPGDRQSLYNLGVALAARGRDGEALPLLLEAEKAGNPGRQLLETIARSLKRTGDSRRAAEYEKRAREIPSPAPPAS